MLGRWPNEKGCHYDGGDDDGRELWERKKERKKRKEGRKETNGDGNCEFEFLAGGVGEERPRRLYRTSVITHTILPHGGHPRSTKPKAKSGGSGSLLALLSFIICGAF